MRPIDAGHGRGRRFEEEPEEKKMCKVKTVDAQFFFEAAKRTFVQVEIPLLPESSPSRWTQRGPCIFSSNVIDQVFGEYLTRSLLSRCVNTR